MTNREVIEQYYVHANNGDWMAWCDLFTDDQVMDEQLAGHIKGLSTLRDMMKGMGKAYGVFQNVPKQILVDGDKAASVSHISARAAQFPDDPIEAEVMNYFELENGKIKYMSNFHDSRPFKPFLDQLANAE